MQPKDEKKERHNVYRGLFGGMEIVPNNQIQEKAWWHLKEGRWLTHEELKVLPDSVAEEDREERPFFLMMDGKFHAHPNILKEVIDNIIKK